MSNLKGRWLDKEQSSSSCIFDVYLYSRTVDEHSEVLGRVSGAMYFFRHEVNKDYNVILGD